MSNLQIAQSDARQGSGAIQQIKPDQQFGNQVEAPAPEVQAGAGTFGDFSGQEAVGKTVSNIGAVVADVANRNMQMTLAEDDANLQLRQAKQKQNYQRALSDAQQTRNQSGWTPDGEHAQFSKLYDQYEAETDQDPRFQFKTNIVADKWDNAAPVLRDGAIIEHTANVVEPQKVAAVQSSYLEAGIQMAQNAAVNAKQNGGVGMEERQNTISSLRAFYAQPQVIAVLGPVAAQQQADKLVRQLDIDYANSFPTAAAAKAYLQNTDTNTDIFKGMDASDRTQTLHQIDQVVRQDEFDAKAKLNDAQVDNETKLITQLADARSPVQVQAVINSAESMLKNRHDETGIDQSHFERVIMSGNSKLQMFAAKQQAYEMKQMRIQEALGPYNYAKGTGVPLDPANQKDRQSADLGFENVLRVNHINPTDAKTIITLGLRDATTTGVIPTRAMSLIAPIMQQGGDHAVLLAHIIAPLMEANPNMAHNFSPYMHQVINRVNAGYDPKDAIAGESALARLPDTTKNAVKADATTTYTASYKSPSNNLFVNTLANMNVNGAPIGTDSIKAGVKVPKTYGVNAPAEGMFKDEYIRQMMLHPGDSETAAKIAGQLVLKNYAPITVDGHPRLMLNSPEARFGTGLTQYVWHDTLSQLGVPAAKTSEYTLQAGKLTANAGKSGYQYDIYHNGIPLVVNGVQQRMAITQDDVNKYRKQPLNDAINERIQKQKINQGAADIGSYSDPTTLY
jgi:hypothetical protein